MKYVKHVTYNDSHVSCVFVTLHETGGTDTECQHTLNQSYCWHNRHVDVFGVSRFQLKQYPNMLLEMCVYASVCVFMCTCVCAYMQACVHVCVFRLAYFQL